MSSSGVVCGPTSCIPKSNKWAVLTVCTALSGSSPSHSLKRTRYQQAADSSQFLTAPYKQNLYKVIAEFATVVLFECCLAGPITYQCYSYSRLPKVSKISTLPEYFNMHPTYHRQQYPDANETSIHSPAPRRAP